MQAATRDQADDSAPFVPFGRGQRALVIAVAVVMVGGLITAAARSNLAGHVGVAIGVSLWLLLAVAPIASVARGWLDPLSVNALTTLVAVGRSYSAYADGMPRHVALPGYSAPALHALLTEEMALQCLATLAYFAGFAFSARIRVPKLELRAPASPAAVAIPWVLLSLGVAAAFLVFYGGVSSYMSSWGVGRRSVTEGNFVFFFFQYPGAVATWWWISQDDKAWRNPVFIAAFAASSIALFLTTGSRSSVVIQLATGFAIWVCRRGRLPLGAAAVVVLMAFSSVALLGAVRRSTWSGEVSADALTDADVAGQAIEDGADENTRRATSWKGSVPIFALVPEREDLLWGASYAAGLAMPIPRRLWKGKPLGLGIQVGRRFYHLNAGVPIGPLAEAYWNFHIPGIIFVFALFGVFHRWLARLREEYASSGTIAGFYVITLSTMGAGSESIPQAMMYLVPYVGIVLFHRVVRFRAAKDDKAPRPVLLRRVQ